MSDAILALDGIETCYGQSQVLFGISLTISPGAMAWASPPPCARSWG
jgi:branched-chain amino acid transport system ATP-binding protein